MRSVNLSLFNSWLTSRGPLAKEFLAAEAKIKFFTLDKIVRGVRMATELEQDSICRVTEMDRDALFPLATGQEKSA
jgi:hypothetical protein